MATAGVRELVNRMSQYKPEAAKGLVLVFAALAAAGLAVLAVGVCTRRTPAENEQQEFPWVWVGVSVAFCAALAPIVW